MSNIVKVDFDNIISITTNGLDIKIATPERVVYTKDLLWIMEEAGLEIPFYKINGKDTFKTFLKESLIINMETLFMFWLHEAILRYFEIKIIKDAKTINLLHSFEKAYKNEIITFKINEEKNEEIKLAKLRLLDCCYVMKLIKEEDINNFFKKNIILLQ